MDELWAEDSVDKVLEISPDEMSWDDLVASVLDRPIRL